MLRKRMCFQFFLQLYLENMVPLYWKMGMNISIENISCTEEKNVDQCCGAGAGFIRLFCSAGGAEI